MKIRNNGEKFNLQYDGKDFDILEGSMEIANRGLATFILKKARAWGYNVEKIGETKRDEVKPVAEITKEEAIPEGGEKTEDKKTEDKKTEDKKTEDKKTKDKKTGKQKTSQVKK